MHRGYGNPDIRGTRCSHHPTDGAGSKNYLLTPAGTKPLKHAHFQLKRNSNISLQYSL